MTTADDLGARNNKTGLGSATITNGYDFNRDGRVDTQDELIARSHHSGLSPLQLITTSAAAAAVAGASEDLSAVVVTKPRPVPRVAPVVRPMAKGKAAAFGLNRIELTLRPVPAVTGKRKEARDSVWDS